MTSLLVIMATTMINLVHAKNLEKYKRFSQKQHIVHKHHLLKRGKNNSVSIF